jgi:hypothetical protein
VFACLSRAAKFGGDKNKNARPVLCFSSNFSRASFSKSVRAVS